jgi:tRNA G46 methylase TrmB
LCGDALKILPNYIAENTLTHVFVNYPEPPQQLGGDDTQSKHLLTEEFFAMIDRVLILDGILTILTDNLWFPSSIGFPV